MTTKNNLTIVFFFLLITSIYSFIIPSKENIHDVNCETVYHNINYICHKYFLFYDAEFQEFINSVINDLAEFCSIIETINNRNNNNIDSSSVNYNIIDLEIHLNQCRKYLPLLHEFM
jgi:hypothetical protein